MLLRAAYQEKNRTTPGLNFVSNVANCIPAGLPGSMLQPYPIEFLFTPGRVTINIETYSVVRRIYTDGRSLPQDPDPSYQGTSAGSWDGDTLVWAWSPPPLTSAHIIQQRCSSGAKKRQVP